MLIILELMFVALLGLILLMVFRHEQAAKKDKPQSALMEECWNGKERRKHVRFRQALPLSYAVLKKPKPAGNGRTVDISEGGAKILLDEKMAPGTYLDLKINIPDSAEPAVVSGEVVWSEDAPNPDPAGKRYFYMGIKFADTKTFSANRLVDYIRSIT